MAYKFQLGAFVASGSIKAEDGVNANSAGVGAAGAIAGATTIAASGLASLGSVAIDDGSTIGTDSDTDMLTLTNGSNITVASDIELRLSNGKLKLGGTAVSAEASELNLLDGFADTSYAFGDDSIVYFDATDSKLKRDSGGDFVAAIAGDGLANSGGRMVVQVSGALKIASDKLGISGSFAGTGLKSDGGADSISELSLDLNGLGAATVDVANDSIAIIDANASNGSKKEAIADLIDAIAGAGIASASGVLSVANASNGGIDVQANTLGIDFGNLAAATVDVAADSIAFADAGGGTKKESIADLVDGIQSTGLDSSAGQLSVAGAQSTITSILNNSFTTIGRGGGADELLDFGTAGSVIIKTADTARVTVSDASTTISNNLILSGDLTVNGTTTTVNSATINVTSSLTFEGVQDDHEITFTTANPTADRTITLPDLTGHVPLLAGAVSNANVTAAEFALLDGGSSVGTTALASGDGFLHNDGGTMKHTQIDKIADLFAGDGISASSAVLALDIGGMASELSSATVADTDEFAISDGGTMKKIDFQHVRDSVFADVSGDIAVAAGGAATIQANAVEGSMLNNNIVSGLDDIGADIVNTDEMIVSDAGTIKRMDMSRLKTFIGSGTAAVASKDDGDTLAVGVNYFANHGGAESVTLPASAGMTVGESVKIKAGSDCSSTNTLTVNKAGSQTIDGATLIVLESPFAAVELVYVAADTWRVF